MTMRSLSVIIIVLVMSAGSCNRKSHDDNNPRKPGLNELAELNRYMVAKDRERIENYAERRGLTMTVTQSGLWYMIRSEGTGRNFTDNDRLIMEYECTTLDGTECYSSKDLGPKEVIVGRSGIEPGLEQGLRLLKPGAEALFIIPPFLGWGIPGDGKKIPPRAVLVYDIKVTGAGQK